MSAETSSGDVEAALKVGVVGAAGHRSEAYRIGFNSREQVKVETVCDVNERDLAAAQEYFGAASQYANYTRMLEEADVDAVFLLTPQHLHASQTVAALERDIHVYSEVPAADSLDQARELIRTAAGSHATYMMGENYSYFTSNVLVAELVRAGLFGDLYYAEGAYINEMRETMYSTWRREYRLGVNGITYGCHQLGPVMNWLSDDRISHVTCTGSGHHYADELGDIALEDTTVLLGKTEKGRLVKIRLDAISNRPAPLRHAKYELQGTAGWFESATDPDEADKVWLDSLHRVGDGSEREAHDLNELANEYLPERYRNPPEEFERAGHYGSDYFVAVDFLDCLLAGDSSPIGLNRAMDITLPGLVSREAIAHGGEWLDVPDPREW